MNRRGTTLAELLIGLGVMALVVTLVAVLLVGSQRVWQRGGRRSQAYESALVVMLRVRDEVRSACPDSMVCVPSAGHDAVLFVSWATWGDPTLSWDPTGQILWQSQVALWLNPQGEVWLRYRPLPTAVQAPPTVTAADLAPLPGRDILHRVAGSIRSLSIKGDGPGLVDVTVEATADGETSELQGSALTTLPAQASPSPTP